ncbi:MAG TPA: FAD-dependent monooxygenase [Propionibacteriaceae bacterium]|nr:FAD-dependent monooxygenase [Propionibacteriaceae bacterium]
MTVYEPPDVLIVGAGPAGLTLSLLLTDLGVRVLCVERRHEVSNLPRARGIHARAAEILRSCDAEEPMRARQLAVDHRMEHRADLVSPVQQTVLTGGSELTEVSPCDGIAISQDLFESVLRDRLQEVAPGALRTGIEVQSATWSDDGVRTTLLDRGTGDSTALHSRYLAAADGWRSALRTGLGIELDGPDQLGTARAVTFRSDLRRWLGDPPPALVNLGGGSVLIATHADHRWMVNVPIRAELPDAAVDLVRTRLGLLDLTVEVLTDSTWTAAAQTARQFSVGPVFLVGDAAHRVPPAGATGVSSAMADAHNLAWKLAAVCRGWAHPNLLDTYAVERRAVALTTTQAMLDLWLAMTSPGGPGPTVDLRSVDMGYRYASAAVAGGFPTIPSADPYLPSAEPGARAPHAWLGNGPTRRSTIDLFGRGFMLLAGTGGLAWCGAAAEVAATTGVPVTATILTEPTAVAAYAITGAAAVLVRPDGHVAGRLDLGEVSGPEAARTKLSELIGAVTGRTG